MILFTPARRIRRSRSSAQRSSRTGSSSRGGRGWDDERHQSSVSSQVSRRLSAKCAGRFHFCTFLRVMLVVSHEVL